MKITLKVKAGLMKKYRVEAGLMKIITSVEAGLIKLLTAMSASQCLRY